MSNTCTIADLKKNPEQLIRRAKRSGRPVVILKGNDPECVLLSLKAYDSHVREANLRKRLEESEADFAAGRYQTAEEFIRELRNDYGL